MSEDLRSVSRQNVQDAIDLMNQSSRRTSLNYDLDIFGFRWLARYWNFSYEHSLICYVQGEPAALIINCTDPQAHDAYTFYWGTLPRFRTRKIALTLFDASCKKLHDDGYLTLYGDSVPDRPVRRYRFIEALPRYQLVTMQAQSLDLPASDFRFEVREVDVSELPRLAVAPGEYVHWCQRSAFLRNAAPFLKFVASFTGDVIMAYAVVLPQLSNITLTDIRSPGSCSAAGYELLRWLLAQDHRPPLTATYVFDQSYAHGLLTAAGFLVNKQSSILSRDLSATCERNLAV